MKYAIEACKSRKKEYKGSSFSKSFESELSFYQFFDEQKEEK